MLIYVEVVVSGSAMSPISRTKPEPVIPVIVVIALAAEVALVAADVAEVAAALA
jgi:hypothetical protein